MTHHPNRPRGNRQRQQVRWIQQRYPDAWEKADALRRAERQTWPAWCYLPMEYWWEIARPHWPNQQATVETVVDFGRLAALGAWRITQGIYRFDPDLYAALTDTPLSGDLPDELLYRLPEWGVYLETPGLSFDDRPLLGVYAHLDHAPHDGHTELRLVLDSESDLRLFPVPVRLGQGSLQNAVQAISTIAHEKMERHFPEKQEGFADTRTQDAQDARDLAPILSLLLYLCADEADYERPPRPRTVRTQKHGRLMPPPENVRVWPVGERLGAALRQARETPPSTSGDSSSTERARPRPHWRRAHWHTFWTGAKDGERRPRMNWLPPIAVKVDAGQELPTVIHPVSARQIR